MSAVDHIATASDPEFSGRVMMIQFKVAQNVASEDPATAHHTERIDYAFLVIRGGEKPQLVAAHIISSNPVISGAIDSDPAALGKNVPDSDIEFAMATIWDARSLAYAAATAAPG